MLYPYPYPNRVCVTGIPAPRVLRHGRTELQEAPVRVILGKIPRVWFCTYPSEHNVGTIDVTNHDQTCTVHAA